MAKLDAEIDRLYTVAPEEFVRARNELSRRLRDRGDAQGSRRVGGLRRPTVPAWALNQAVRSRPSDVDRLLKAGEGLRRAQRKALSGVRDTGLREAAEARRKALRAVLEEALAVLEQSGRSAPSHEEGIRATLEAASVDQGAAERVREGRLSKELPLPSGFGMVEGLELVPTPPEPPSTRQRRERPRGAAGRAEKERDEREALKALKDERAAAAKEVAEVRRAADRAGRQADRAAREATRAEERAERLRGQAEEARHAAREAAAGARRAAREAQGEEAAAERAARRLQQIDERVAAARG
jgi:hypothetical protein